MTQLFNVNIHRKVLYMKLRQISENASGIPAKKVRQSHDYDCGAAALRSVAASFGVGPDTEEEFIEICKTCKETGTPPNELVRAAKNIGLKAKIISHMGMQNLMHFLDRGKPVICAIQAWGKEDEYDKLDDGHYIVAIAYDDKNIYFEDPSMDGDRGRLSHDEFLERWKDRDYRGDIKTKMGIVFSRGGYGLEKKNVGDSKKIP